MKLLIYNHSITAKGRIIEVKGRNEEVIKPHYYFYLPIIIKRLV